jgi:aspartyl-tRNA(Asn)/glutamyl-tRNA(Gln) amidotransferase subunit A
VKRARHVYNIIKGADPLDQSSRDAPQNMKHGISSKKIAALKIEEGALDAPVAEAFAETKAALAKLGFIIEEVAIPELKYVAPAYYTIATAEASANLARFDGIRYGARPSFAENPDDLVDKTRDAGFGDEVKLRILLGTFVLRSGFQDRYYLKAQRLRAGIKAAFEALLESHTALLMPVFPTLPFRHNDNKMTSFQQKSADLYTCCANLAGLPSLAFPTGTKILRQAQGPEVTLPTGVQILGRAFNEDALFDIAGQFEAAHPFPHPALYKSFW